LNIVKRYEKNPIIGPKDVKPSRPDFEVICAFNAGVTKLGSEIILLLRVAERPINNDPNLYLSPVFNYRSEELVIKEFSKNTPDCDFSDSRWIKNSNVNYLTSISHLRIARSTDGLHFVIDEHPALFPANVYEEYGIEDARITLIDGTYYITYSAISSSGITTCMASTMDFKRFFRHGVIFCPDNKDVEIFPEKINGLYYALHRPFPSHFGTADIWIAQSPDLIHWGNHKHLMGTREGFWDDGRIGGSAIPFKVPEGWIEIYHGASKKDRYCLGAVLLDHDEPWKVISRVQEPIMEPEETYEVNGFFNDVVFTCGLLIENDMVRLYYGAADTYVAYAEMHTDDILQALQKSR
jgi:predicted GH43/DUF377 family glycosyl hydrolase